MGPVDVTIRRVRADEAMALKAVRLAALADAPTAFGSTYAGEARRPDDFWRERAVRGATGEASVMFVADWGDDLVGLAGGYRPEPFTDAIELVSMWVRPDARRHGVAAGLVDAVVDWAVTAGVGAVELWVTASNLAAAALYERCGFVPTGRRQPLPSDPSLDEVQMRRPLRP